VRQSMHPVEPRSSVSHRADQSRRYAAAITSGWAQVEIVINLDGRVTNKFTASIREE
jgi:hypothetical protein